MITEHRIRVSDDAAAPGAAMSDSNAGNRRTQRKCHSAPQAIARNIPAVPMKIRVAHMI
jgi:hypothetical protein